MPHQTAKLFTNGRSQAVRLPREFRFHGDEVSIRRAGEEVVFSPRPQSWDPFFAMSETVSDDFLEARQDRPPQERESL
ncbi:MAG: antitoxin [Magnetococcales bacterium]|nr:antitoxin [Magnetococcales bacterium]